MTEPPKSSATLRRFSVLAGNGAALLFIAQRIYSDAAPQGIELERLYWGGAMAGLGVAMTYLALFFERHEGGPDYLELLGAFSFASLIASWLFQGLH